MFLSAAVGIGVNLFIGFGLQKEGDNLNVRAAALHVFGDVGASVAVVVAGLAILLTGWTPADPLLSIGIAVLIAVGAWRILRETMDILLEAVPKGINMAALVEDMRSVPGVQDVHDLHVWSITSGMSALSCHALIDDLPPSESRIILQELEARLNEHYRIGHTTIQFESHAHQELYCSIDGLYCRLETVKDEHDHSYEHEDHAGHDHTHTSEYAHRDDGGRKATS